MNEEVLTDKLNFFAYVTANITHEIKNCLAIINESNGLMEDMLLMAQQGMFAPEKFQELINQNFFQIKRANDVVGRLNWFSHSIDQPAATIESQSFLENMIALVSSITAPKKIRLVISSPQEPINWKGSLFGLHLSLYLTLQHLTSLCQSGETIKLILNREPSGRIIFTLTCEHTVVLEMVKMETHTLDYIVEEQGGEVQISYPEDNTLAFTLSFPETIE